MSGGSAKAVIDKAVTNRVRGASRARKAYLEAVKDKEANEVQETSGAVLFAAHRPSYSRLSLGVASWEGDLLPKTQAKLIAFDPRFGERAVVVDESGTSVHLVELATLTNSSMNDNEGAVARSRQQFCREQSAACLFPVLVYATASPQQDDRITAIVWWQNEKKGQ
ncbi:unnamed protein product, partial [Cyprideis torosa]